MKQDVAIAKYNNNRCDCKLGCLDTVKNGKSEAQPLRCLGTAQIPPFMETPRNHQRMSRDFKQKPSWDIYQ